MLYTGITLLFVSGLFYLGYANHEERTADYIGLLHNRLFQVWIVLISLFLPVILYFVFFKWYIAIPSVFIFIILTANIHDIIITLTYRRYGVIPMILFNFIGILLILLSV